MCHFPASFFLAREVVGVFQKEEWDDDRPFNVKMILGKVMVRLLQDKCREGIA